MYEAADNYKADLRALVRVVEELRKYDAKMELGQLLIYLLIAARPGIKVPDLGPATGLSRSAISRNILALSRQHYLTGEDGKPLPGHDLVTQVSDPFDARAKLAAPTGRGEDLARKISNYLRRNKEATDGA